MKNQNVMRNRKLNLTLTMVMALSLFVTSCSDDDSNDGGMNNTSVELFASNNSNGNITVYNTGEMDLEYSIDPYGYQSENSDLNQNYNWVDISNDYETITFSHNDNSSNDIINFDFVFSCNSFFHQILNSVFCFRWNV